MAPNGALDHLNNLGDGRRLLPLPAVAWRLGVSKSSVYRLMTEGGFPKPLKIVATSPMARK